jgi:tetratricopeptide (TPR) repeat protein
VPRGFGLIIGVGAYPNLPEKMRLQYAEADAEAVYDVLISKEGGNFAPEDVRKLVGKEATLANIRNSFEDWLPSVAKENDRVIIFFAGHGFEGKNGKAYFAPWDVKLDNLSETAYPMEQLGKIVSGSIRAKWKVLFADACHSGAITPEMVERVNTSLASSRDLLAFTATRKREVSYEDKELGHGVFSYFLVQGLRSQADRDQDGRVTADELIDYVRYHVREHTFKRGATQTPVENQEFDPELVLAFNPSRLSEGERSGRDGTLVVESNRDGVEFLLDGTSRGIINKDKPLRIPGVSAGTHSVQGVKQGYYPDGPREILVYPGRETTVRLRIQLARVEKKAALEQFEEARKLYERGREADLRKAVVILKNVLAGSPDFSQAALYLGRAYQVLYETDAALAMHKRAIEIDPDYLEARLSYAAMLLDLQDTDEAIRQARQVLSRDPANSLAYSHMAHAYRLADAFDQSAVAARKAIELDKSNAQAYLWLAECLRYERKFEDAKAAYLRFLQLTDFESRFHEKLAFYFLSTPFSGVFSKRRPTQMAVFRDQRNIAHFGLCVCEQNTGNLNLATTHCRKALEYDPKDAFSYYHLGWIATEKYNLTSGCDSLLNARDCYRKVISINAELDEAAKARQYLARIDTILQKLPCRQ